MTLKQGYHWTRRFWRPSRQQRLVLDLLVQGRTNPEIADQLGMTLDGAKWHVSNLFEKTDCETRQELAQWWLEHEERYDRSLVAGPVFWFALRAAAAFVVIAVAVSTVGVLFFGLGRGGGHGEGVRALTAATPAGSLAAAPLAPSPTATPPPQTQAGAWVLDSRDGSAAPLPGLYYSRRWLDPRTPTFLVPQGAAVVDAGGQQTADLGNLNTSEYVLGYANQDNGNIIVWRPQSGDLSIVDSKTKAQLSRVNVGASLLQDRVWDLSMRGGRIALSEVSSDQIRVFSYALDGSEKTQVYTGGSDAWVVSMAWSPDGGRLLLSLASRAMRVPSRFLVVDSSGRRLLDESGTAIWAGSSTVLARPAWQAGSGNAAQTTGEYIDMANARHTSAADAAHLLCVSPDGRFGVFYEDTGPTTGSNPQAIERLKELGSGAVVASAMVARNMVDCDWTWDSKRVVMSPGGK